MTPWRAVPPWWSRVAASLSTERTDDVAAEELAMRHAAMRRVLRAQTRATPDGMR